MNTILKARYGTELTVHGLVVARNSTGGYISAGTVYPFGRIAGSKHEIVIIDNENDLCDTSWSDASNLNESDDWRRVEAAYTKAGFCTGDIVPVKKDISTRNISKGCVWCLSQFGHWIALPESNLTKVKVHMSAQALTARMKSAAEVGTSPAITICVTGGGAGGAADVRSMGGNLNFIPGEITLDRVVKVEFSKGGKLYTYRLKDGMIAEPGDDAVVVVNNPAYPELKGTKVVRVKEVDVVENLGGSYKYIEHIVSNEAERKAQQEVKRKRAESRLTKKRAELNSALKEARRIETELNQLAEDFHNGKY